MSNKRITDLTELTTPTTDDVFPVVDIATNTTTKVQLANLPVQTAVTTALATKQATLVSGTNIKTVNSTTLLGSGDIAVQETLVSGTNIKTLNSVSLLGAGNIVLAATPSGVAGAIQFSDGSAFSSDATKFFWDNTNKRLGVGTNAPSSTVDINSNTLSNAMFSVGPSFATGFQIFNTNNTATPVYGIGINGSYINTRIGFYDTLTFRANGTQIAEMTSSEVRVGSISGARVGIKGSGSTSATTSLLVQNSAGTTALTITDSGLSTFSGTVRNTTGPMEALSFATSGAPFSFGTTSIYNITGTMSVLTSGQRDGFLGQFTFAPTSGTAVLNVMNASPTINQTGGANGITSVQASAILQADSTTKGFLPPRMTTTQKNAIASPAAGLVLYDSTTNKLQCYNGSTWNDLF